MPTLHRRFDAAELVRAILRLEHLARPRRLSVGTYICVIQEKDNALEQPGELLDDVRYPERLSRFLIFVKWLLIIPHLVVLAVLGGVAGLATFLAWFASLFTGAFPRSLFDFCVGVNRWSYRVLAYWYLLTDQYPPFTLGPDNAPEGPDAALDPYAYRATS